MAANGLVLRPTDPKFDIVSTYYKQAPHEPTRRGSLAIDRVEAFGVTFLGLARAIHASKRSHLVVVGHGSVKSGLLMTISPSSKVSAGEAMGTLLPVVDSLDGTAGKSANPAALAAAANDWAVPESEVLQLAQVCRDIRSVDTTAVAVHVRGCNIGAQPKHLRNLRALFRSQVVSAPNSPMFYVNVRPSFPVADVDAWATSHQPLGRRFKYTNQAGASAGPIVLDCEYRHGLGVRSQAAVRERADIKRWAAWFQQNGQAAAAGDAFALSGFYPEDSNQYFLAVEPGYVDHLVVVTD
jgi:hypothetical protein